MSSNYSYIKLLLDKEKRIDDRKLTDYRSPIIIEKNASKNAEGSARVKIGNTEVIVGVKFSIEEPYPDSPDQGTIIVTAELLPLSSPEFELGPPGENAVELARIVDRGIRESGCIDFKKLCIKKGEKCWILYIDIYTINDDGNLIDASALAALAALSETRFPKVEEDKIKFGEFTNKKLELENMPITVTLGKINNKIIVDPNTKEEAALDARLTICSTVNNIHAMQKGGDEPLTEEEVLKMIDIALEKAKELRKLLK